MRAIQAIGFDLEGPIIDFEKEHFDAHCAATQQILGVAISYDWIIQHVPNAVGGGDELIAGGIARHYHSAARQHALWEAKKVFFAEVTRSAPIKARPGAIEAIEWFVSQGFPVAVGSNTPRAEAHRYLHETRVADLVRDNKWVLAEDIGKPKPHPSIWQETAKRNGVEPRSQLIFDDSPAGNEAAFGAGSPSVATPLHRSQRVYSDIARWEPLRFIHDWREVNLPEMMENLEKELRQP